jgi:hypothetical protein
MIVFEKDDLARVLNRIETKPIVRSGHLSARPSRFRRRPSIAAWTP